eukprot:jgi/Bigna1/131843/aug1.15_g6551
MTTTRRSSTGRVAVGQHQIGGGGGGEGGLCRLLSVGLWEAETTSHLVSRAGFWNVPEESRNIHPKMRGRKGRQLRKRVQRGVATEKETGLVNMEVEQKSSSSDAPEPRIDRDIKRELKNYKKIDRNWTYPLPPRNIEERLSRKAGNATEFSRNMLYNMSGFEKSLMERATGDDLSDEVTRKAHMKEILYKLEKYSVLHSKIKKKVAERDRYFKTTFKRNDNINQRRSFFINGNVSTLVGTSKEPGSMDGNGQNISVDRRRNIFIGDTGNNVIRKISPEGEVTTFAGTGMPSGQLNPIDGDSFLATFDMPKQQDRCLVCHSRRRNVVVMLSEDHFDAYLIPERARYKRPKVGKINPKKFYETMQQAKERMRVRIIRNLQNGAQPDTDLPISRSSFQQDGSILMNLSSMYSNPSAKKYSTPEEIQSSIELPIDYPNKSSSLGALYQTFETIPGAEYELQGADLLFPEDVALRKACVYVTDDYFDFREKTGRKLRVLFIVLLVFLTIVIFAESGQMALDKWPIRCNLSYFDFVKVTEVFDDCIDQRTVETIAGSGYNRGVAARCHNDGLAREATFDFPLGLQVHPWKGDLYIADANKHNEHVDNSLGNMIRKVTKGYAISPSRLEKFSVYKRDRLRAGCEGLSFENGDVDGVGSHARFSCPDGLCVAMDDSAIYVADVSNHKIRKIVPTTRPGLRQEMAEHGGDGHHSAGNSSLSSLPYDNIQIEETSMLNYTVRYFKGNETVFDRKTDAPYTSNQHNTYDGSNLNILQDVFKEGEITAQHREKFCRKLEKMFADFRIDRTAYKGEYHYTDPKEKYWKSYKTKATKLNQILFVESNTTFSDDEPVHPESPYGLRGVHKPQDCY